MAARQLFHQEIAGEDASLARRIVFNGQEILLSLPTIVEFGFNGLRVVFELRGRLGRQLDNELSGGWQWKHSENTHQHDRERQPGIPISSQIPAYRIKRQKTASLSHQPTKIQLWI